MAAPSRKEISKLKDKIAKLSKGLNEDGSPKRSMDDNLAKALFRDAVRKKWMYHPTKLSFLLKSRIHDHNPYTRTKWLQECAICKKRFKEGEVNVDHIYGDIPFTEWQDAQKYASSILDVKWEDLQILCIEDHATKTRGESLGIDWRTKEGWALILKEQEFTKIMKSKAKGQKGWLTSKGISWGKNEEVRKQQIREVLFNEQPL